MQDTINQHKTRILALLLFFLLAAVYFLTYSGTFMTDDEHILASRSLSLGLDSRVNNSRVYGNSRLYAFSILPEDYSSPAVNVEPAQAILGAVLVRLAAVLDVGRIQALYLSNIYIVALTGVFLFLSAIFLGYSKITAFITGILFGLGTIAWPFSKTYFRDPLAMMFVSLAWTILLYVKSIEKNQPAKITAWAGLIVSMLAGILSKNTATLLLPVLFLYLIVNDCERFSLKRIKKIVFESWKMLAGIGGALLVLLVFWLMFVPGGGMFTRISYPYYKYLVTAFLSKPHPGFFRALIGPLLSPGKSIFIYSPILVLAVIGSFKRRDTAWPAWMYLSLLILGQAVFYDDQWWGFVQWGLRYLLPSLPLLMIAAVPVIDHWLESITGRFRLYLIGCVSLLMQILGSIVPVRQYFVETLAADPELMGAETIWTFSKSAIPWHISWIRDGNALDLAISRMGVLSVPVVVVSLLIVISVIYALKKPNNFRGLNLALGLSFFLPFVMLFYYKSDPVYYPGRGDLVEARKSIEASFLPGDAVIIQSYNTPVWYHWMNWAGPDLKWIPTAAYFPNPDQLEEYQMSSNPEKAMDGSTLNLFRELPENFRRAWIVAPQDSTGGTLYINEEWLSRHYNLESRLVYSDAQYTTSVNLFSLSASK